MWQKPLALAACSFEEALLLDADNAVLRDPTPLFEAACYRRAGAVFWDDMYSEGGRRFVRLIDPWNLRRGPSTFEVWLQDALDQWLISGVRGKVCGPLYQRSHSDCLDESPLLHLCTLLSVACVWTVCADGPQVEYAPVLAAAYGDAFTRGSWAQESGQVLVHKSRHVKALAALTVLNANSHRRLVYAGLHGDKDTFRIAWRSVGSAYHDVAMRPLLGGDVDARTGVFHDTCFVQPGLDEGASPLFTHYCGRHRGDDEARLQNRTPESVMTAEGRPFRLWPVDARRGYTEGRVVPMRTLVYTPKS